MNSVSFFEEDGFIMTMLEPLSQVSAVISLTLQSKVENSLFFI